MNKWEKDRFEARAEHLKDLSCSCRAPLINMVHRMKDDILTRQEELHKEIEALDKDLAMLTHYQSLVMTNVPE
jgi:hypothetical protein